MNGSDDMISTAEKLSRLEMKIEKRKVTIAEESKKLNADLAEYDKLCLLALAYTRRADHQRMDIRVVDKRGHARFLTSYN